MNKFVKPIDFKQESLPWRDYMYSSHGDMHQTMRTGGSAPTLCADIVATLKERNVDPWGLAQLSMEWGCRTYMSGTCYPFFAKVAQHYGFKKFVQTRDYDKLVDCLDAGGYVVCNTQGYWAPRGNYILVWGYDDKYVYCIMAQKTKRYRQKIDEFKAQSKMYFCFYPD